MDVLAQLRNSVGSSNPSALDREVSGTTLALGLSPIPFGRHPVFTLSFCCTLVAAHLLLIVFQPSWADGLIYPIIALSVLLCSAIFYLYGRSSTGTLSLRWQLFALATALNGLNYMRAGIGVFLGDSLNTADAVLRAISGTLAILALTLPAAGRSSAERSLDLFIALFFCAIRIVYLHALISPDVDVFTMLTHTTFESGIGLLLVFVALVAAPRAELKFFGTAMLYLLAAGIATFCTNQIGFLWMHQYTASPWSITTTALRVATAVYLLHDLTAPAPIQVSRSQKAVLSSLVPFVMSCFVVWVAVALLPAHPHLGQLGIAVGIGSFLVRTGLAARGAHQKNSPQVSINRPITIHPVPPPKLYETDRSTL